MGLFDFFKKDVYKAGNIPAPRRPRFQWIWWQWIRNLEQRLYRETDNRIASETEFARDTVKIDELTLTTSILERAAALRVKEIDELRENLNRLEHAHYKVLDRVRILETKSALPHDPTVKFLESGSLKEVRNVIVTVAEATDREIARVEGLISSLKNDLDRNTINPVVDMQARFDNDLLTSRLAKLEKSLDKIKKVRRTKSGR